MKAFIAALLITASASAETIIIPVQDLMFEVPNFVVEHDFNVSSAADGIFIPPSNLPRGDRKARKELERKLISIMWEQFPDAHSIRILNGNLIVRMP